MARVGFIGLGRMGRGMALGLVKASVPTVVFDLNPAGGRGPHRGRGQGSGVDRRPRGPSRCHLHLAARPARVRGGGSGRYRHPAPCPSRHGPFRSVDQCAGPRAPGRRAVCRQGRGFVRCAGQRWACGRGLGRPGDLGRRRKVGLRPAPRPFAQLCQGAAPCRAHRGGHGHQAVAQHVGLHGPSGPGRGLFDGRQGRGGPAGPLGRLCALAWWARARSWTCWSSNSCPVNSICPPLR